MTTICYNHNNNNNNNWVHFNSHENQCFADEEEQEEEALSLCDLPITSNSQEELETINSKNVVENDHQQQDFEFGPCLANTATRSQDDNMCNADEVFFQGQLLPLRHSVSYEKVDLLTTRKINRSMSDPRTIIRSNIGYKPRVRNLFHSHPSPSPQIRSQSFRALSHSNPKSSSSSLWSFLQVSFVKPQEIGLSDLKNRSKRFGSHNSNSSSNSSGTVNSINSTTDQNQNQNRHQNPKSRINNPSKNTKKKQRLFFGGCKCSADSIERTIKEQVPKKKTTREENMIQPTTTATLQDQGKQTVSRHRTFEWLKQLSIAAAQSET